VESHTVKGILELFNSGYFYFSEGYDLSRTYYSNQPRMFFNIHEKELDYGSEVYVWNNALLQTLKKPGLFEFSVPVIQGYVGEKYIVDYGADFQITLISRISTKNAGPRYRRRGLDKKGNAAMFAETEVIYENTMGAASFLQTRGSVPLFWTQSVTDFNLKPVISVFSEDNHESYDACTNHLTHYIQTYSSPVVILSLLNRRGHESALHETSGHLYERVNSEHGKLLLFHHDMNDPSDQEPLSAKLEQISNLCGFFVSQPASKSMPYKVIKRQKSVCR
jgi:hypothetical protein